MTDPRQDEREKAAQNFCVAYADAFIMQDAIRDLKSLLKATEAATLEEAANMVMQEHRIGDRDGWIDFAIKIRGMAKERRS